MTIEYNPSIKLMTVTIEFSQGFAYADRANIAGDEIPHVGSVRAAYYSALRVARWHAALDRELPVVYASRREVRTCPMCQGCEVPYGICGACGGSGYIDSCGP